MTALNAESQLQYGGVVFCLGGQCHVWITTDMPRIIWHNFVSYYIKKRVSSIFWLLYALLQIIHVRRSLSLTFRSLIYNLMQYLRHTLYMQSPLSQTFLFEYGLWFSLITKIYFYNINVIKSKQMLQIYFFDLSIN